MISWDLVRILLLDKLITDWSAPQWFQTLHLFNNHSFHHTKHQGSVLVWFGLLVVYYSGYWRELDGRMQRFGNSLSIFYRLLIQYLPPKSTTITMQSSFEVRVKFLPFDFWSNNHSNHFNKKPWYFHSRTCTDSESSFLLCFGVVWFLFYICSCYYFWD